MSRSTKRAARKPKRGAEGSEELSAIIDRAARVIAVFAETRETLSLLNISRLAQLDKSTTFRVLCTLVVDGLVAHDAATGVYSLGFLPLRLADSLLESLPIRAAARLWLEEVHQRLNETVTLSLRVGTQRVNIEYLCGQHAVVQTQLTGVPFELHVGAPGRAMLASLPFEERTNYLEAAGGLSSADKKALLREIGEIAERGCAISRGECSPGGVVLAAAFQDSAGALGALHTAVPAARWSPALERRCAEEIVRAASSLSAPPLHSSEPADHPPQRSSVFAGNSSSTVRRRRK